MNDVGMKKGHLTKWNALLNGLQETITKEKPFKHIAGSHFDTGQGAVDLPSWINLNQSSTAKLAEATEKEEIEDHRWMLRTKHQLDRLKTLKGDVVNIIQRPSFDKVIETSKHLHRGLNPDVWTSVADHNETPSNSASSSLTEGGE